MKSCKGYPPLWGHKIYPPPKIFPKNFPPLRNFQNLSHPTELGACPRMIWCIFFFSFNPKISWSTNVFILNLALADLLNCVINIPIYLIHTLHQKWPWGLSSCKFSAYIRFSLSFVSWMSVALIAVHRCIGITINGRNSLFNVRIFRNLALAFVWLYGFSVLIPFYLGIFGELGYNCQTGNCYIIPTKEEYLVSLQLLVWISTIIPCSIVTFSYLMIGLIMWNSRRKLKEINK